MNGHDEPSGDQKLFQDLVFEFEGLLENAVAISRNTLHLPHFFSSQRDVKSQGGQEGKRQTPIDFFDNFHNMLKDLSDFKKINNERAHLVDFDLFFKLITKEIVLVIKMQSRATFLSQEPTAINMEFYILKKRQVSLSQRLRDSSAYKHLIERRPPSLLRLVSQRLDISEESLSSEYADLLKELQPQSE